MEGRIEDGDMAEFRKCVASRLDPSERRHVVQRSERFQGPDLAQDIGIDDRRIEEARTSVHDSMRDCGDRRRLDLRE
jgi:hypothetical protein